MRVVGMKMDIEGFEARAIEGGKRFIALHRPCYIWFEYVEEALEQSGVHPHTALNTLDSMGYQLYDIATAQNVLHPPWRNVPRAMFFEAKLDSCDLEAIRSC